MKSLYESEWFLGKMVKIVGKSCLVRCFENPYGVKEPQDLEPERDTVVYNGIYSTDGVTPQQTQVRCSCKWIY